MSNAIRPLCFVAMPFGKKRDTEGQCEIDFDRIYEAAIRPAAERVGVDVIRADEERSAGIIHVPMFERLLLAEIVIVDLTLQNPNVFYELGVRHCARPRATILIYARDYRIPFDVALVRAVPYDLEKGVLSDAAAMALGENLEKRLRVAVADLAAKDSPLFQLISQFPGIDLPHDVTESFRDRVVYFDEVRRAIHAAREDVDREDAARGLRAIEGGLGAFNETHTELLVDLLLAYRDVKAWDDMIRLVERLPGTVRASVTIREQFAFALNRRNEAGDRRRAAEVLQEVVDERGPSPETCGLLGRIYKDGYEDGRDRGKPEIASAHLDQAIGWYRKGFEADPRDYYPGINLATLLFVKGTPDALEELRRTLPVVSFAAARRGGMASNDYWDVSTVLEAAVLGEDWEHAKRAAARVVMMGGPGWTRETTARNLGMIRSVREDRDMSTGEIDEVVAILSGGD